LSGAGKFCRYSPKIKHLAGGTIVARWHMSSKNKTGEMHVILTNTRMARRLPSDAERFGLGRHGHGGKHRQGCGGAGQ
jgi:hypothetical protein